MSYITKRDITKTRLFKYIENFTTKKKKKKGKFSVKNPIFHISGQNMYCGYSLESPRRGGSKSIHNVCFGKKGMYTLQAPVLLYISAV